MTFIKTGLNKSEQIFSAPLFYIISTTLVTLICLTYNAISITYSSNNAQDWSQALISIGYMLMCALTFDTLWFLNEISWRISVKIKQLHSTIMELNIDKQALIHYNDQERPALQIRAQLAYCLEDFKGFSGNGFFLLGRPFLSSLTSSFLTYIIILIQFRLSEK